MQRSLRAMLKRYRGLLAGHRCGLYETIGQLGGGLTVIRVEWAGSSLTSIASRETKIGLAMKATGTRGIRSV
jgi:hypothetical protein